MGSCSAAGHRPERRNVVVDVCVGAFLGLIRKGQGGPSAANCAGPNAARPLRLDLVGCQTGRGAPGVKLSANSDGKTTVAGGAGWGGQPTETPANERTVDGPGRPMGRRQLLLPSECGQPQQEERRD